MVDSELAMKLQRRLLRSEAECDERSLSPPRLSVFNIYGEFHDFSRAEIKRYEAAFKKYDLNCDKVLDIHELKVMMEKIGAPQTHLALKRMIQEVDLDGDNKISFREFMLVIRKARNGSLPTESGLDQLYHQLNEIDVNKEGVKFAKDFFDAKASNNSNELNEILSERRKKERAEEEKMMRKKAFKEKQLIFTNHSKC